MTQQNLKVLETVLSHLNKMTTSSWRFRSVCEDNLDKALNDL